MSLFLTDVKTRAIEIRPIPKMGREAVDSNELYIDDLRIPVEDLVGEEGKGFTYLLDGLNPERILIAAEALGLGRVALKRAVAYANERVVFGRPIGRNQGIQFPLADSLMRLDAAEAGAAQGLVGLRRRRQGRRSLRELREVPLRRGRDRGGRPRDPDPRRLRLRPRVPRGAVLQGGPAAEDRAAAAGDGPQLRRRARARPAEGY